MLWTPEGFASRLTGGLREAYWRLTGGLLEAYWGVTGGLLEGYWVTGGLLEGYWRVTGGLLEVYWRFTGPYEPPEKAQEKNPQNDAFLYPVNDYLMH